MVGGNNRTGTHACKPCASPTGRAPETDRREGNWLGECPRIDAAFCLWRLRLGVRLKTQPIAAGQLREGNEITDKWARCRMARHRLGLEEPGIVAVLPTPQDAGSMADHFGSLYNTSSASPGTCFLRNSLFSGFLLFHSDSSQIFRTSFAVRTEYSVAEGFNIEAPRIQMSLLEGSGRLRTNHVGFFVLSNLTSTLKCAPRGLLTNRSNDEDERWHSADCLRPCLWILCGHRTGQLHAGPDDIHHHHQTHQTFAD